MSFYAHTKTGPDGTRAPKSEWEPLFTPFGEDDNQCQRDRCEKCAAMEPQHGHLNKVAYWTAKFATEMFPENSEDSKAAHQWGYLAGLWHDLGKFAPEWQEYLSKASDPHHDEILRKIDHTTAGAKHAISRNRQLGHFIATAIAGHHAGLLDAKSTGASLEKRLGKAFGRELPLIKAPTEVAQIPFPSLISFLVNRNGQKDPEHDFALAFFQQIIFSSLVDADFLATEAFMNPTQAKDRPSQPSQFFQEALSLLSSKIQGFGKPEPHDQVAIARATVVDDCSLAANEQSGIFTLTVPTGGGKTLSSLNFALRHAIAHGKRRVIYVIPFTSIIEQNAAVFRKLLSSLGQACLIEHHSNLAPELEESQTETSRLAAENWDAPIIVTTAVQFYESLFAAKTSRSRKIHNIANSVVILDEAQCIPTHYLDPCLRALRQLTRNYATTTVLCTATQPALASSENFPIGLLKSTEIIKDIDQLFEALDRVLVEYRGRLEDQTISRELSETDQALCIVNTKPHARKLFQALPKQIGENFHLSTLMCPQHRLQVLDTVKQRLEKKLPVRLVSTQLIEAGVDIDFPTVYRSMAGLDSVAQAAGRCNREGTLPTKGNVNVFHSEHVRSESYFAATASVGHEFLNLHQDAPLSTPAIEGYFKKYYHLQKDNWDSKDLLGEFQYLISHPDFPCHFNYRTAADKFRLIEDNHIPVLIPWDDEAKDLCKKLRTESIPLHRNLLRSLQRYTVQIRPTEFSSNSHQFESLRDGQFHVLICPETHYSDQFGLNLSGEAPNSKTLVCE